MRQSALALALVAVLLAALASGLRPDAFFVGDPGIKLIVARGAIDHPSHPLDIPLPVIGKETLPFVEPFFEVHEAHAHGVTSEFFPLLSAPLIRWLGIRGAYVLPALGFLGILAATAWLAFILDDRRRPVLVIGLAALCTPFLFYGLEFWEHAPAVALATAGAALFLRGSSSEDDASAATGAALSAGVFFGLASLLRPEALCFLIGVIVASWSLPQRANLRAIATLAIGVVVAVAPLEIYTLEHFGRLLPSHVSTNSGLLANSWFTERLSLAATWLIPSRWAYAGPVRAADFWTVSPAAILACVPLAADTERRGRRFLTTAAIVTAVLIWLIAPNDGGGEWGPRYLLFAYVPLVILAADVVDALPRRSGVVAALALVVVASAFIQRAAYRQLRGAKATYGRVVDLVNGTVAPDDYIVTDLWWVDQVAASATSERRMVYAADTASGQAIMRRMSDAVVPIVGVIRSRSESPDTSSWTEGTCYVEIERRTINVRDLVVIVLHHRCKS